MLGGYSYWDWKRSRPEFSEIADRLLEGIRLYKHGRIRKLVLASDGSIIESKDGKGLQGNAADMKQYLADLGMPLEDVILETRANNTWENATFTLELIGNSMKTEFDPADYLRDPHAQVAMDLPCSGAESGHIYHRYVSRNKGGKTNFLPSWHVLASWPELTHEWVGYLYYRLRHKPSV